MNAEKEFAEMSAKIAGVEGKKMETTSGVFQKTALAGVSPSAVMTYTD